MTDDEKDRALCEAHCNSAADEYFNARPQLDSSANRRIFYAGHRKAWIERGEAVRLNAQADAKPIYQYQLATGGWIDQTRDSYEYNKANGVKGLRIVYEAAPAAPQPAQPLTDEQINAGRQALPYDIEDKPEPWSFKEGVRFAERKHGIGGKSD